MFSLVPSPRRLARPSAGGRYPQVPHFRPLRRSDGPAKSRRSDDFGSGYSGLRRLADLQPDSIKIERALLAGCDHDRTRLAILANVL